ncbi:uncharacterized protein A4U43_C08F33700 [Asparagus officinalis]|nr:uncharacterized protein A4U43_C08F33700 [Asparagus officinalis]
MILRLLLIETPTVRPSVMMDNSTRSEVSCGNRTIKLRVRSSAKVKDWVVAINDVGLRPPGGWCMPHCFGSFDPPRGLTEYGSQVQWFVDGQAAFGSIASSIEVAKSEIFIIGWWLCLELCLRRPFHIHASSRLDSLLEAKAKQGVNIYILLYKEVVIALKINSIYSKRRLLNIHENVKVLHYPDHFSTRVYLWSHHDKIVIVDNQICYLGGLDLCFGRYDNPEHRVGDFPPTIWPRKDYYNLRLGLKVASGFCEGIRVQEAKKEAFNVKDNRGELYKKHYTPALKDERCILDIDVQGARSMRAGSLEVILVFICHPSFDELEKHLRSRLLLLAVAIASYGCYRVAFRRSVLIRKSVRSSATSSKASISAPPEAKPADKMGDGIGSVKQQISRLFETSLKTTFPDEANTEPMVAISTQKFADYQCNNAMSLFSKIKGKSTDYRNPNSVGQAIARNLPPSDIIESTSVAGPGFVNVVLSSTWVAQYIQSMLLNGIETWAPLLSVKRAVVDFSSPNIAKEMHVGHLRSTIIGDTLARMLEFSKVDVLRRNHVGDWGTQLISIPAFLGSQYISCPVAEDSSLFLAATE